MSAQHTPGPWETDAEFAHEIVLSKDGVMVADCFHRTRTAEANRANARLIAAAPDLLAALKAMTEVAEGQGARWREKRPDGNSPLGLARAAIAKAEGRS